MISQVLLVAVVAAVAVGSLLPESIHHAPKPYKFGYNIKDKHGDQYREEVGDGASGVKGSYGFTDARGVHRRVDYVADHAGFKAQVKTNEPGTANQDPAAVKMISSAPYAGHEAGPGLIGAGYAAGLGNEGLGYRGLGYEGLAYGGLGYEGLGYGERGYSGIGYGLGSGYLGGLGYARYGY